VNVPMDAERWKRVDDLLQSALQVPAGQQEEFLRQQCGDDSALLEEIRSLIKSATARAPLPRLRAHSTRASGKESGPQIKSPSPRHRFVIALDSPSEVAETGLLICPSEKKARNLSCDVKSATFSGPLRLDSSLPCFGGIDASATKYVSAAMRIANFAI
jgi:hypothetical protein